MVSPFVTPLRRIWTPKGDVLHGMKASDAGFDGFGEAYFSMVPQNLYKGWKRHRRMTLNLICPSGAIRILVHDGNTNPNTWLDVILSPDNEEKYGRLTVPPMYWVAFGGVGAAENILLNVASIPHDPDEAENVELERFQIPVQPLAANRS